MKNRWFVSTVTFLLVSMVSLFVRYGHTQCMEMGESCSPPTGYPPCCEELYCSQCIEEPAWLCKPTCQSPCCILITNTPIVGELCVKEGYINTIPYFCPTTVCHGICCMGEFQGQGTNCCSDADCPEGYYCNNHNCTASIPTLTEWGMIIFITIMMGIGVMVLRKRRMA